MERLINTGMLSALYAAEKPNKIAVMDRQGSRTFLELHQNANRLANGLIQNGLTAGDSIAVICGNRIEFVETLLAALRIGLRLTPVNWHLSEDEAHYIIADCEAKALIAEAAIITSWQKRPASLECGIVIAGSADGYDEYQSFLTAAPMTDPAHPTHGTVMLYTSGTTGRPKGVYRAKSMPVPPQGEGTLANFDPDHDAQLVCGPMYHAAPLLFDVAWSLSSGVRMHLLDHWDSEEVLHLIDQHGITHAHMVPIMFQRLLGLPESVRRGANVTSLKRIYHGAAPCPADVKRAMIDWFGPIIEEYYAGSEGGAGFVSSSNEWLERPGSVGRVPFPDAIRIVDESGAPVSPGEDGEIYHRVDPNLPFEYFKSPEKTAGKIRDGYFTLGDIGHVDADGYLFLTGRSAECIISGGVNIYPTEIDNVICQDPLVEDVCVIGAPNDEWGEEVRAVVQLVDGTPQSPDVAAKILERTSKTLSGYKMPRQIDFVDKLPRLPSGKIPRRKVRETYWQGRARQI
jgi:long-chain acyl-CoA synthetase